MEMFESNLEALMLTKTFEELTEQERIYVLQHVTAAMYANYRLVLLRSARLLENESVELVPDSKIPVNLKAHFDAKLGNNSKRFVRFDIFALLAPRQLITVATLAATVVIAFFIVMKQGNNAGFKRPPQLTLISNPVKTVPVERTPVESSPVKIMKDPVIIRSKIRIREHVRIESAPIASVVRIDKVPEVEQSSALLGLHVYEPLLCLDLELNQVVPGLRD